MRMKNILLTGIALLLVLAMAGCDFGTGSVSAPGTADYSDEAVAQAGADPRANPLQVAGGNVSVPDLGATAGTLDSAEDQYFTIDFNNGVVDADALSAITVYPVSEPTNAYEAWSRGTALSVTTNVRKTGNETSTVTVSMDLSSITTDRLEVVVGSALTANNGARTINQDGDDLPGEAEDEVVDYVVIDPTGTPPTGFTATNTANATNRLPRGNFAVRELEYVNSANTNTSFAGGSVIADTTIPSTLYVQFNSPYGTPTDTYYNSIVVPNNDVMRLQQFSDGEWTNIDVTYALATTVNSATEYATYSITGGSLSNGGFYRFKVDNSWQSAAFNGYAHRLSSNDQFADGYNTSNIFGVLDTDNETVPNAVANVVITTPNADYTTSGVGYIDVTIADRAGEGDDDGDRSDGDTDYIYANPSTVTADVFRILVDQDGGTDYTIEASITSVTQTVPNGNTYRLELAVDTRLSGADYLVQLLPGVVDNANTTTGGTPVADDAYVFGTDDFPMATVTGSF